MVQALECCTLLWPHKILKATKDGTRIYVFVGNRNMLVRLVAPPKQPYFASQVHEANDNREVV